MPISGANGPTYQASLNGIYMTRVTLNGCSSNFSNSISFVSTAVNGPYGNGKLTILPNPATHFIEIAYPGYEVFSFTMTDISGRQVALPVLFSRNLRFDVSR